MKHVFHKLLAIFLTLALLCTCLPIAAFASDEATLFDIETPVIPVEKDSSETETPETDPEEDVSSEEMDVEQILEQLQSITIGPDVVELNGEEDLLDTGASLFSETWGENDTCYGDQLTGTAKSVYQDLEAKFENGGITYQITDGDYYQGGYTLEVKNNLELSKDELSTGATEYFYEFLDENTNDYYLAMYAFTYDHPEYFWIRTNMGRDASSSVSYVGYNVSTGKYIIEVTISVFLYYNVMSYYFANDNSLSVDVFQSEIDDKVSEILAGCEDETSTVIKLAYFDRWLAENRDYNDTAASAGGESKYGSDCPWNIIGGFLDYHSPVCEGYAKAFQVLCRQIDVPCIVLVGDDHMWNAVQLEGVWYCVDSTWDDNGSYTDRDDFLTSSTTMVNNGHTIEMSLDCPTLSTSDYFSSNSLTLTSSGITGSILNSSSNSSGGAYYIALYDANGKFLELQPCISFQWTTSSTSRGLAPTFTNISSASSGKLFAVADDTSWTPKAAAVDITAG